jgi:hypothetical protein
MCFFAAHNRELYIIFWRSRMKRQILSAGVLMMTVLGLAVGGWAGEASVFDAQQNWLIRAYTESSGNMVKLEVRDTNNALMPAADLAGISENPETVATDAASPDISLAFNNGTAYLFYSTGEGPQLVSYTITKVGPNISVSPNPLAFGNVNVGATSDKTVNVSNIGTANLVLGAISVSGTGFTRNGGTCVNGQTLAPGAGCTVTVRFAPASATSYSGSLSVLSNDVDVNVALSGTGQQSGGGAGVDLFPAILTPIRSADNGVPFTITVRVTNGGTSAAGAFAVKGWFRSDSGIPADKLLFTWNVTGLDAGSSRDSTFQVMFTGFPIHHIHQLVVKADSENQITESNEANNEVTKDISVSR